MVQLEKVIRKTEEEPFYRYIRFALGKEAAKVHILFGHEAE